MKVVGIYRSMGSDRFKGGVLESYASKRGMDGIAVIEATDEPSVRAALTDLEPADAVVFYDLADIADRSSAIEAEVKAMLAKGVDVHAVPVGQVGPQFRVLSEAWSHGRAVEGDLEAANARAKAEAETWAGLFEEYQRTVAGAIVKKFGAMAMKDFPELDFPPEVIEEAPAPPANKTAAPDYAAIGELIKWERLSRHWTQKQMAEQLRHFYQQSDPDARTPDTSAISRAESTGQGPHIRPLLELLTPDDLPPPEIEAFMDWEQYVTQRIKVRKARSAAIAAAEQEEWDRIKEERLIHDFGTKVKLAETVGHGAVNGLAEPPHA